MADRVCVVLVTHNRLPLLRESLLALAKSTVAVEQILVVDNQSTDGTADSLAAEFSHIKVIRTDKNVGSAGGYFLGIQWAHLQQFDWIWTLDDDSIAEPDALSQLLGARSRFPADQRPNLLASKAVWSDGTLHPMNIPKPKLYNPEQQFLAASCGTMSIRFTSFVSMLIHRSLIDRFGLPIAGYFLWNDDVEFSARLLRTELGVLVPASVVCHKTALKHVPATSGAEKYYYEVRNKLWILRLSDAFSRDEKWWMAKSLLRRTLRHISGNHFSPSAIKYVLKGIADGFFTRP